MIFDHLWPLTTQDVIFYANIVLFWSWLIYESTMIPTYRQLTDEKYFRIRKPKFLLVIYGVLAANILSLVISGIVQIKIVQYGWQYSPLIRTMANSLAILIACVYFIYFFSLFFDITNQHRLFHEKAKIAFQYLPTLKTSPYQKTNINLFAVKYHSILSDPFQISKLIGLPLFFIYVVMFYLFNSINFTLATLFHTIMLFSLIVLCIVFGKKIAKHEDSFFCRGMFNYSRIIAMQTHDYLLLYGTCINWNIDDIIATGKYMGVGVSAFVVIQVIDAMIPNIIVQYTAGYAYTVNTACVLMLMIRMGIRKSIKRYLQHFQVQRNVPSILSMSKVISDTTGYFVFMRYVHIFTIFSIVTN